jgi:hypothetical protein
LALNTASILAMILITMLEIIALVNGINGALLAGGIAIIAGLGGYQVRQKTKKD